MSGKPSYSVEYATLPEASCMAGENPSSTDGSRKGTRRYKCRIPIVAGNVQISRVGSEGEISRHHLRCFADIRQSYEFFDAGTALSGYNELRPGDQEQVKTVLPKIEEPVPPKKSTAMSLDTTEPEDQKMTLPGQMDVDQPPPADPTKQDENAPAPVRRKLGIDLSNSDFAKISGMPWYVDKTLLIDGVIEDHSGVLVTSPKRWGKSTNISMLNYFFRIQTHRNGAKITDVDLDVDKGKPVTDTTNYALFKNFKVAEKPAAMKHLGKYPVIRLNLMGEAGSSEGALGICRGAIFKAYEEHKYLRHNDKLDSSDRNLVAGWLDDYITKNWEAVERAIEHLSRILHSHYEEKKKCIILVDEYDSIITHCLSSQTTRADEFGKMKAHIGNLLTFSVKSNKWLARAFLTGITFVTGLWSGLNNVRPYRFLGDHQYNTLYGLTDEEVKKLLAKTNLSDRYDEVRDYYNGYTTLDGRSIYSIWSIMSYLETKKLKNHWCGTGSIFLLSQSFTNLTIRRTMADMMESRPVGVAVRDELSVDDIERIKAFVRQPDGDVDEVEDAIFSLFLDQGCLAYAGGKKNMLIVPNTELRDYLYTPFCTHFESIVDECETQRNELTAAFDEIFKYIYLTEKLPSVLREFLEKMNALLNAVCPLEADVYEATVKYIFCRAAEKACKPLNLEQRIRDKLSQPQTWKRADYCSVFECNNEKIGVLVELKVAARAEDAKNHIIDRNYIRAFSTVEELLNPPEVFVVGLSYSKAKSEWELIYTRHVRGDPSNEKERLTNSEWNTVTYP